MSYRCDHGTLVTESCNRCTQRVSAQTRAHNKMTLRDQFAMAALTGMLAGGMDCSSYVEEARRSYESADAMLAARADRAGAE